MGCTSWEEEEVVTFVKEKLAKKVMILKWSWKAASETTDKAYGWKDE